MDDLSQTGWSRDRLSTMTAADDSALAQDESQVFGIRLSGHPLPKRARDDHACGRNMTDRSHDFRRRSLWVDGDDDPPQREHREVCGNVFCRVLHPQYNALPFREALCGDLPLQTRRMRPELRIGPAAAVVYDRQPIGALIDRVGNEVGYVHLTSPLLRADAAW